MTSHQYRTMVFLFSILALMEWSTSALGGGAGSQACGEWPSIEYEIVGVFRSDGSLDVAETARWRSSPRVTVRLWDPLNGSDGIIQYYEGSNVYFSDVPDPMLAR